MLLYIFSFCRSISTTNQPLGLPCLFLFLQDILSPAPIRIAPVCCSPKRNCRPASRNNVQESTVCVCSEDGNDYHKRCKKNYVRNSLQICTLESHPVLHYRITLCSTAPLWLFGVGHGFVRDWGQSQQCLQTMGKSQQEMAKSKYDLYDSLSG